MALVALFSFFLFIYRLKGFVLWFVFVFPVAMCLALVLSKWNSYVFSLLFSKNIYNIIICASVHRYMCTISIRTRRGIRRLPSANNRAIGLFCG